jgi:SAM-dependent methyltransferase
MQDPGPATGLNLQQLDTIEVYDRSADRFQATIAQLENYNETYACLLGCLRDGDSVLDLACGPGNISRYLATRKRLRVTGFDLSAGMLAIARETVPGGSFHQRSIIGFNLAETYDAVINGFGLPYLDDRQAVQSLRSSVEALSPRGALYLSFMEGDGCRLETPSFNHDVRLLVHYHRQATVIRTLGELGLAVMKEWELDYLEEDGSVTNDVVIIAQRPARATDRA